MTAKPTYAHTPGGGPAGERCRTCEHAREVARDPKAPRRSPSPWCAEALRQARSLAPRGGEISLDTAACKFWAPRVGHR